MHRMEGALDAVLEASVIGSFSSLGIRLRRRTGAWQEIPPVPGRWFVVTGASSGIGRAVAVGLGRAGASLSLLGRDAGRTEATAAAVVRCSPPQVEVETAVVDVTDPEAVSRFARDLAACRDRLDGLVHAAGALFPDFGRTSSGVERTVDTHVLGPFRLTRLLAPMLRAGGGRIVTVSSGGMYTQPFDLGALEMGRAGYRGATAYARAKRAQVVLAEEWARRWGEVASYSSHPGWVDTPGLASGLPSFSRLGPLLRTPEEGADTVVWLAAGGASPERDGFWHDRRRRSEHRLARTTRQRRSEDDGIDLWNWCWRKSGLSPAEAS